MMGLRVGTLPVSAFVAILVALVLIGGGVFAYRQGYIRSRAALVAIAILVGLLIVWRMAPGVASSS